jgi:hypothetical protein
MAGREGRLRYEVTLVYLSIGLGVEKETLFAIIAAAVETRP